MSYPSDDASPLRGTQALVFGGVMVAVALVAWYFNASAHAVIFGAGTGIIWGGAELLRRRGR